MLLKLNYKTITIGFILFLVFSSFQLFPINVSEFEKLRVYRSTGTDSGGRSVKPVTAVNRAVNTGCNLLHQRLGRDSKPAAESSSQFDQILEEAMLRQAAEGDT